MNSPINIDRPSKTRARPRRGFALIIVISLLALLIMVLVSLATLTRIEAGVGANSLKQAQAQQNARFALDLAIGELQRHAGPDLRVTRSAQSLETPPGVGLRDWVGVWNSNNNSGSRTWLVSRSEGLAEGEFDLSELLAVYPQLTTSTTPFDALRIVGDGPGVDAVLLIGPKTAGDSVGNEDRYVVAPLVELRGPAADGAADTLTGRYAWYVADEGTKASLAMPDRLSQVNYAPFDTDMARLRLRQQVAFGHQSFRATGATVSGLHGFDPALGANRNRLDRVLARNQIAFLSAASGVSLYTSVRERFHDWTTIASGVLASTNPDHPGLKHDLSLAPMALGEAFARWQDFAPFVPGASGDLRYIEPTGLSSGAVPEIESLEDPRRRYRYVADSAPEPLAGEIVHRVHPVLTDLAFQFIVRRVATLADPTRGRIEVTARMTCSVWNPYTSALIPQMLELAVSGLPEVTVRVAGGVPQEERIVALQDVFSGSLGNPMTLRLPYMAGRTRPADGASWLPGRVHTWRSPSAGEVGTHGLAAQDLIFYGKRVSASGFPGASPSPAGAWVRVWTPVSGDDTVPMSGTMTVQGERISGLGNPLNVTVRLQGETLAIYTCPPMPAGGPGSWAVGTAASPSEHASFGFGFRLRQPAVAVGDSTSSWLDLFDPRSRTFSATELRSYLPGTSTSPADYSTSGSWVDGVFSFLLSRDTQMEPESSLSAGDSTLHFDNDTPIFELPRSPLLSLGQLQHLRVHGQPALAFGRSSSASAVLRGNADGIAGLESIGTAGSLFDRFFFSGLTPTGSGPDIAAGQPPPMYHLQPIRQGGAIPDLETLRTASPYSSRHVLMQGSFNANSVSSDAWAAVLRSMRPFLDNALQAADLEVAPPAGSVTGTVGGTSTSYPVLVSDSTQASSGDSASSSGFLRFPQSIQETFKTIGAQQGFTRTRYRVGFRGGNSVGSTTNLTSTQIEALASAIVARVREAGPIRTMEQFVGPTIPVGAPTRSILEAAIDDVASINANVQESASQRLTQADILTAIAPFLQCRSDTFLIRAYGETLNPVTQEVEARAWCEATVQRIPTPVDPNDDIVNPTEPFGRRFVITSFRWLSPDDI